MFTTGMPAPCGLQRPAPRDGRAGQLEAVADRERRWARPRPLGGHVGREVGGQVGGEARGEGLADRVGGAVEDEDAAPTMPAPTTSTPISAAMRQPLARPLPCRGGGRVALAGGGAVAGLRVAGLRVAGSVRVAGPAARYRRGRPAAVGRGRRVVAAGRVRRLRRVPRLGRLLGRGRRGDRLGAGDVERLRSRRPTPPTRAAGAGRSGHWAGGHGTGRSTGCRPSSAPARPAAGANPLVPTSGPPDLVRWWQRSPGSGPTRVRGQRAPARSASATG